MEIWLRIGVCQNLDFAACIKDVSILIQILCGAWNDSEYKKRRCDPAEFERRYGSHGIDKVWR